MREIEQFTIDIIDTKDNTRVLQLEDVAVDSVRLIYNGQEDRFGVLTTSELHFSMLVENAEDGKFFHLFTGSETRYKVELYDTTDSARIPTTLWIGYLLPEQFEEPYIGGNFFVDFIASDGVARLKTRDMVSLGITSVIEILKYCLGQSGVVLPIHLSKAIENSFFDLDYLDLEVDTDSYVEDELSCYDVLERLLESLGLRLFQYNSAWWVVGLTRFSDQIIPYRIYPTTLPESSDDIVQEILTREQYEPLYEATPQVTAIPPLKRVRASWDDKEDVFVTPTDLVGHFPKYYSEDKEDTTVRYWSLTTDGKINSFTAFVVHEFQIYDLDSLYYSNGFVDVNFENVIGGPFLYLQSKENLGLSDFNQTSGILFEDIDQNYITLEEPLFLDLKQDEVLSFELELKIPKRSNNITDQELNDAMENNLFQGIALYGITYKRFKKSNDEEFVIHNFSVDQQLNDAFGFEFSYVDGNLKARVFIEEFRPVKKGYYNIKLYPVIKHELLGAGVYFEKCELKFKNTKAKDFSISRDIDFSTDYSLDLYHSSTERKTTKRSFYLSDTIQQKIDNETLIESEHLVEQRYYQSTLNSLGQTIYQIGVTNEDYYRYQNGYEFYVKKEGNSLLESMAPDSFTIADDIDGGKYILQVDYNVSFLDFYYVQQSDELYLKRSNSTIQETCYKEYYSDTFTRYYALDVENFSTALVKSYHDLLDSYKIRFAGKALTLVSPFDMLYFRFKGRKLGTITSLELDLVEGTTEVTLIDHRKGLFNDTVSTGGNDTQVNVEPNIQITAELFSPSTVWSVFDFNLWWYLRVGYTISNLIPVNATLKIVQLENDPNNILGLPSNPTGLEIEATITEASGHYRYDFPNPLGEYSGYFEVSMAQGAVESNKELIYLPPENNDPRVVTIEKLRVEQISYPDRSVYRMYYTIEIEGFDPLPTAGIQKVGQTTAIVVVTNPDEVHTNITLGQSEYMVEYEGLFGFYVKVEVDGIESNLIHSYL